MNTVKKVDSTDMNIFLLEHLKRYKSGHGKIHFHTLAKELVKINPVYGQTTYKEKLHEFVEKFPLWESMDEKLILTGKQPETTEGQLVVEGQKSRNRIRELESENSRLKKMLVSEETLLTNIQKGMSVLPVVEKITIQRPVVKSTEEEVTLMLSDHHINRIVKPEQVEGYNEYNFDVFANRYWFLIHEVLKIVEANRKNKVIKKLNVDILGDMFNDIHRHENNRSNEFNPIQAAVMGSYVLAQGLAILAAHFDEVEITGVIGNEPRLDIKKPAQEKFNNFDYLCYQIISVCLAEYIRKKRVKMNIPMSPEIVVQRMGRNFLLIHGDQIRGWMGIPFYGIERHTYKQQRKRRHMGGFDYMEMGHFHDGNKLRETLMNGALCGVDAYAYHNLSEISDPTQKVFGINKKYGVSWMYDINCREAQENGFTYSTSMTIAESMEEFDKVKPTKY